MKKWQKRLLCILVIALVLVGAGMLLLNNMRETVRALSASMPDLSAIPDGDYAGAYPVTPVHAEVEVSVADHRVTRIDITQHKNAKGGPAERIVDDVVQAQSLDVDAVSGATTSSKCILKAVENALEQAEAPEVQ